MTFLYFFNENGPLTLLFCCRLPRLHLLHHDVIHDVIRMIVIRRLIFHLDDSPIVVRPVIEKDLRGRLSRTCAHCSHRCVNLQHIFKLIFPDLISVWIFVWANVIGMSTWKHVEIEREIISSCHIIWCLSIVELQ